MSHHLRHPPITYGICALVETYQRRPTEGSISQGLWSSGKRRLLMADTINQGMHTSYKTCVNLESNIS